MMKALKSTKKRGGFPPLIIRMNYLAILRSIQEYEQVVQCKTFRCHTMKQL